MNEFRSPAVQAVNLIRYIGDQVSESGQPIGQFSGADIQDVTGAPSSVFAQELAKELCETDVIKVRTRPETLNGGMRFMGVNLTLAGWDRYEAEKRGEFGENYGFIAMQFDEPALDSFVQDIVKPAVKEGIGYDLVDMRDVPCAGVIDSIMRIQIRNAAFVLVDLTHNNPGAYWEAGYAEGLGKSVIYLCEKEKFEARKTHFDTNHCTTVPWSRDDDDGFRQALIATLRRSLELS